MNTSRTNQLLVLFIVGLSLLLLVIPFSLAILWSLVDPSHAWSYPDILPPVLSFRRWIEVWTTTSLPIALMNSYTLAPTVALCTILLALPTAFAFGRLEFPGKAVAQSLTLLPLMIPSFVVALFFSSLLTELGIYSRFLGILIGHTILFIPYAIRILSVSFSLIRQDIVDATRDLGGNSLTVFRTAYLPTLRSGLFASFIMVFIMSIEEFALAFVIGSPDFTTVPTILYSYLGYNFIRPNAAVVSLILVVPNVFLMLLIERFLKGQNTASITGKG
ncbi:spermidine/putrescine ABC transporter permease [Marinomonas sp. CT5]|uniref:ABC transporter permease n=1 Tax=Marinomonas sp. CT5 TaxID=2066133 RepID=UPI001BAF159A|nr:ABC transporter permease subunit [Marinomonas sp. CT5]QUX97537.1 spermidine/putrescine ABC transporter permease [Marinomonas sp. CT5]